LNVDFDGPSLDFPGLRKPAHEGIKERYRRKSRYFTVVDHRCEKRLQRLQKNLCKRVYYFVYVYLNKNHMSETKQNYDSDEDN